MVKDFWLNLPVKNVKTSREFFTKMGFSFNPRFGENDNMAALMIGEKNTVVMLCEEPAFKMYISNQIADTKVHTEVLMSIDAQSKEEVDEMAQRAIDAGGASNHTPTEMPGWLYGCLFTDPDGHSWNVLHMDMSKAPKQGI
jgi:predicted lactoylglutathione lyase